MKIILSLSLLIIGITGDVLLRKNVLFQKVNEVTTTRSRWLVTCVIETDKFHEFIRILDANINQLHGVILGTLSRYHEPAVEHFANSFEYLLIDIKAVND